MSRRLHPIDRIFRKKLENHASETPMHLWEGIEAQRNAQQKIRNLERQRMLLVALLILGVFASGISWYSHASYQPELGNFPIWESAAPQVPLAQAEDNSMEKLRPVVAAPMTQKQRLKPTSQPTKNMEPLEPVINTVKRDSKSIIAALQQQNLQVKSGAPIAALQLSALPIALREVNSLEMPEQIQASGCADFTGNKLRFYFDAMAAPGLAVRSLDPRGSAYAAYANSRAETESPQFTYSATLRLSAVMNSGFAVRTGINYSEIKERFKHTIDNEVRTIITNIYDQNGVITRTDTTIETNSRQVVANNSYRTLDIPLLIGFERSIKNVTLSLNGGAYLNVMFKPQGEFLSPDDNRPIGFSNDAHSETYPAFREDLGIGWYGSFGVQYKISPRLQLMVEPHVRMYPQSFTREDFMVDQKYLTAGVFVGVRHQFQL